MLELSRQKLKEDLYNVGAFAIETYGALQIQVTQEDTVRDIDSEYFYRSEKKNLQQIDKYYLVVGAENFIYGADNEKKSMSALIEEINSIDPDGRNWEGFERAGRNNVLYLLNMMRRHMRVPDEIQGVVAEKTFRAPVEFNKGFYMEPLRWCEPKEDLFEWFCLVDSVDKFTDLVGLNWGAETFLEWHNSENA